MVPDRLLTLDALPLTTNGKIDRKAIIEHLPTYITPSSCSPSEAEPLNANQRAVAGVWATVLELDSPEMLTPSSSFFDVDGDSLLLAKCIGGLRKAIPGADKIAWDELLRQVVASPTLEHCTRVAWQYAYSISESEFEYEFESEKDISPISMLLSARLPIGKSRNGEVLCLIHDGLGRLEPYRSLIAALESMSEHPTVLGVSRIPRRWLSQPTFRNPIRYAGRALCSDLASAICLPGLVVRLLYGWIDSGRDG